MQWPRELARQLTHPLALLLWVAALLSFIVGSITVGVAVVLIIVLNAAVAFVQERHAENAVEALAGYIPQKLTVVRDARSRSSAGFTAQSNGGVEPVARANHGEHHTC